MVSAAVAAIAKETVFYFITLYAILLAIFVAIVEKGE